MGKFREGYLRLRLPFLLFLLPIVFASYFLNLFRVKAKTARFLSSLVTFILLLPVLVGLVIVEPILALRIFSSKEIGMFFSIGMPS